jgi:hypothetical protein
VAKTLFSICAIPIGKYTNHHSLKNLQTKRSYMTLDIPMVIMIIITIVIKIVITRVQHHASKTAILKGRQQISLKSQ